MYRIVTALIISGLMIGCSGSSDTPCQDDLDDVTVHGDTLIVNSQSPISSKLVSQQIVPQPHQTTLQTSGVVEAVPTAYAEVASPFSGRVQRVMVTLGQHVSAGQPLFEISSSDHSELLKSYRQAETEMNAAEKRLGRARDLNTNHLLSDKELEEAVLDYRNKQEEFHHAQAVAREYQIDPKHAEIGQPLVVRSPIAGRVLRNELVRGTYIREDAEACVLVADLSKVWVKAHIEESDARLIDQVHDVEIRLVARPDSAIQGRIVYRGGILDAETRSIQAIIECDNPQGVMMPNMYAQVILTTNFTDCLIVPKSAVLQGEEGRYVLRKIDTGVYVRTPVTVYSADADRMIITSGVGCDDEIVTEGAIYLIDCK